MEQRCGQAHAELAVAAYRTGSCDDPGEQRDLAAADPDRVARMTDALDAWFLERDLERRSA